MGALRRLVPGAAFPEPESDLDLSINPFPPVEKRSTPDPDPMLPLDEVRVEFAPPAVNGRTRSSLVGRKWNTHTAMLKQKQPNSWGIQLDDWHSPRPKKKDQFN